MAAAKTDLRTRLLGGADRELLRRVFQIGGPATLEAIFVGLASLFDTAQVGTLAECIVSAAVIGDK